MVKIKGKTDDVFFLDADAQSLTKVNARIDFESTLFRQIERILRLGSLLNTYNVDEDYLNSIKSLEDVLVPFFDKEYIISLDDLKEQYITIMSKQYLPSKKEKIKRAIFLDFARKKYRLLCLLMSRQGFLPDKGIVNIDTAPRN